ncbi:MAG: DUF4202 family protein [Piscirickettsiaceae bacterium]|nr:DUF4202 family protein [Piscirickettsiaceae bacterium]
MNRIFLAKGKIRSIISQSTVPEDPRHADNVLEWLLRINPDADIALQLAALAHDIDRADEITRIQRANFNDYDNFKSAHANNSAIILQDILQEYRVEFSIIDEACRLVILHEIGGDARSDLLKDVDSISYFEVNMPLYLDREGYEETVRRCIWGYNRLSSEMRVLCDEITYSDDQLDNILQQTICSFTK